jgi:hypothetical protein
MNIMASFFADGKDPPPVFPRFDEATGWRLRTDMVHFALLWRSQVKET